MDNAVMRQGERKWTTFTQSVPRNRIRTVVLWALQLLAAGMFLMSGTLKVTGVPIMVQMFDAIGVGQWFRYAIGTIELAGALLLLVPSLALLGAVLLAATMGGAVITHLFVIGGSPATALVLLAATATIAWLRRSER